MSIPEHLRDKVQEIPEKPGIYQMKDSHGNIIYIGKSKSLNKRVKSYFYSDHEWTKKKRLVFNIHDIDIIVTDTHLEAQLLECTMIKKYTPIYNSQFVRDKNYVYLKIEGKGTNPLSIIYNRDGEYTFGPYRSKHYIYDLIELLTKLYPIRKVGNSFEFQYHPLPIAMNEKEFQENKKSLIELFSNMDSLKVFLDILKTKMDEASLSLHFERASQLRDIYLSLEHLYRSQNNNITKNKEIIMGEKVDGGYKIFYISDGYLILKRKYKEISIEDVKDFINRANILKNNRVSNKSEKSIMDFKSIINKELKNSYFMIIDEDFKANKFIKSLVEL